MAAGRGSNDVVQDNFMGETAREKDAVQDRLTEGEYIGWLGAMSYVGERGRTDRRTDAPPRLELVLLV